MFGLIPFSKRNSAIERKYHDLFDFNSILENFFNDTVFPSFYSNSGQMKVDIRETDKEYIVEAELPGVKKDEINVEIDENRLTIAVQRSEQVDEQKDNYIRKERRCCSMARSFAVDNILIDKVTAKFENGLLVITLPKKEHSLPKGKRIDIA